MRVVLDTNVLVAAFIARGVCAEIFERVISEHELELSPHLLGELDRVMSVKLRFDPRRVEKALYWPWSAPAALSVLLPEMTIC